MGAQGTLGVLTDVTLKLTPEPRARRSLAVPVTAPADGLRLAAAVASHALVASSIVLADAADAVGFTTPYALLYTAEGLPEDVDAELAAAARTLRQNGAPVVVESAFTGVDAWRGHLGHSDAATLTLRVGVPVMQLPALLRRPLPAAGPLCIDYAAGHVYLRVVATATATAEQLADLRRTALGMDGYAVLLETHAARAAGLDPWGAPPSSRALMQRLKDRWDPAHILNPHAFLVQ